MSVKGIDVSYWQEKIDWKKVKADGVKFAVLREGYRKTIDERFIENVKGCIENGISVMVYHFIYTDNCTTIENAKATVQNMKAAGLDVSKVWIFADLEYDTWKKNKETCTREKCSLYTLEYIRELENLGCKKIGIYMNCDYYKNYYMDDIKKNYKIWLADYNGDADFSCSIHQYSDAGKVRGINGNVDMNMLYDTDMLSNSDNAKENTTMKYDRMKVVEQARSWLGCNEADSSHKQIIDIYNTQNPLPRGYRVQYTDAWCATFVSAIAIKLKYTRIIPTECSCDFMIRAFQSIGCWVEDDSYVPAAGDVIFYDWQDDGVGDNTGSSDHVGVVESCNGKTITVIEGNKNDAVERRAIAVNGRYIRGFGVPRYDTYSNSSTNKKSIAEIANDVIKGAYGNGDTRRKKLESLGYNYAEVQNEVNRLLNKKDIDKVVRDVINGKYGNMPQRKKLLEAAGYNYSEVQKRVNQLL